MPPPPAAPPAAPYYPPPAQYAPPPPPPPYPPEAGAYMRPGPASDASKVLAAIGYLVPLISLVMLFVDPYKDEKFVKFHSVQSLALVVASFILLGVLIVPILGLVVFWFANLAIFVFRIVALVKALQAEYYEVPLLYPTIKGFVGE